MDSPERPTAAPPERGAPEGGASEGRASEGRASERGARARIIAPVRAELRRAGLLAVLAGMIWPLQAAAIAWAIAGWATGTDVLARSLAAALAIGIGALVRAGLEHRSGRLLFEAADRTIARERQALLLREARARAPEGSATVAALALQKLPLLQPWITRYHVAMTRVAVLPALLLLTVSISWAIGLVLLVAGPLIPVFMALVGMAAEAASRRQLAEIGTMNDMLMDRLSALLDIRLLGAADRAAQDFSARAEALRERTMAVLRIAFLSSTVMELFSAIGVAMVAVFVGFSLLGEIGFGTWGAPLTLGEGVFLLLIAPEFFQPLRDLAAAWHDRAAGQAVVAELEAFDRAERVTVVGRGEPAAPLAGPMSLELSGAVAALPARALPLPAFAVAGSALIALSGPSGAGKSTTLAAIAGLVPLAAGRITVCGRPLGPSTADAWRARLAYMAQAPHFPDQMLADYLDPLGEGADPWHALDLARARQVVEHLPAGLRTRLGETGGGVSGGEARRLMLARAILTGGDLLLADEPTADLDSETAAMIIAALRQLKAGGRTVIVATHDPALIAVADRTVEITP